MSVSWWSLPGEVPFSQRIEKQRCPQVTVISSPYLGGLHHRCYGL
jgi:hypothetical protein